MYCVILSTYHPWPCTRLPTPVTCIDRLSEDGKNIPAGVSMRMLFLSYLALEHLPWVSYIFCILSLHWSILAFKLCYCHFVLIVNFVVISGLTTCMYQCGTRVYTCQELTQFHKSTGTCVHLYIYIHVCVCCISSTPWHFLWHPNHAKRRKKVRKSLKQPGLETNKEWNLRLDEQAERQKKYR